MTTIKLTAITLLLASAMPVMAVTGSSMQASTQRVAIVQSSPPVQGGDPCLEVSTNAKANADQAAIKAETITESGLGDLDLSAIRSCSQSINALTPPSVTSFLSDIGLGGQILSNLAESAVCNLASVKKISSLGSQAYSIGSNTVNGYDAYNSGNYSGAVGSAAGVLGTVAPGTVSGQVIQATRKSAQVAGDLYDYSMTPTSGIQ